MGISKNRLLLAAFQIDRQSGVGRCTLALIASVFACAVFVAVKPSGGWNTHVSPKNLASDALGYGFSSVDQRKTTVAFLGNSMFYFNDFPNFFQTIAGKCKKFVYQNSCLHGGASIPSLLQEGNGMWPLLMTEAAILGRDSNNNTIYDYGACTIEQLLLGNDARLKDLGYAVPVNSSEPNQNPCRKDLAYLSYTLQTYSSNTPKNWDFVLINDNTRNPSRARTRAHSLQILELFHLPWFRMTGATPVFLWTQAYQSNTTAERNMTGLEDIANFTSLTYVGLKAYVNMLKYQLPASQKPRIAPVGLAFLMVYEERPDIWKRLFHCDNIHASPSGTFLQGCIIFYTLFGRMPDREQLVLPTDEMPSLWKSARMMQHPWEPPNPFPDYEMAAYLYRIAERIMVEGQIPRSFINYQHGEAAQS